MTAKAQPLTLCALVTLLGSCSLFATEKRDSIQTEALSDLALAPSVEAPQLEDPLPSEPSATPPFVEQSVYSDDPRVDERKTVISQELVLDEGSPPKWYSDEKPGTSPLVITKSASTAQQVWMAEDSAWKSLKTALVHHTQPAFNVARSQVTIGNAVDGELIKRGMVPVDRTLLLELEREVWLASKVLVDLVNGQVPSTFWGWKPLLETDAESSSLEMDAESNMAPVVNWASILNGSRRVDRPGPRAGFLDTPQVIVELDGPTFESEEFNLPVTLLDGRVEDWIAAQPRAVPDRVRAAMEFTLNGALGGRVEDFVPCFMDPNTGAFWGLTGIYKETSLRIDEFMHWKYKHLFCDHTICEKCAARTSDSPSLELPEGIDQSYEAIRVLIEAGCPENEVLISPVVQQLLAKLQKMLRPTTPWQRVNPAIPNVPPTWRCPECKLVRHVEFLIGYHPEGGDEAACNEGDWRTHASWGVGAPGDGVYLILAPDLLTQVNGLTSHEGDLSASEVIASLAASRESSVAVVQEGQVFVLPRRLIEFDSEAAVCRIPAFDETGAQVYDRLAGSPYMEPGMQAFLNSKASLGCRIIETESSRVLGVANLQLSFREIMDAPANIPVVHGRVASEVWETTANQERALTLALAKHLLTVVPLVQ